MVLKQQSSVFFDAGNEKNERNRQVVQYIGKMVFRIIFIGVIKAGVNDENGLFKQIDEIEK